MAKCRYCGADIIWIKLMSGKANPCDPLPVYVEDPQGHDTVVTADGRVAHGRQDHLSSPDPLFRRAYVSHFATCPKAGEARRR